MSTLSRKDKRRFWRDVVLWRRQKGRCYWCNCEMVQHRQENHKSPPSNASTLDHLRDRNDPSRDGNGYREARTVLACWECNFKRGRESVMSIPIEERRRRSGRTGLICEETGR